MIRRLTLARIGGSGIVWTTYLGSGYSVEEEQVEKAKQLEELCREAVKSPAFEAKRDTTYCNKSVRFIAQGMNCYDFKADDLANDILNKVATLKTWKHLPLEKVSQYAMQGRLIILGCSEKVHGHVVVGYPDHPQPSGSWGGDVPMVAHVGVSPNGILKLSQAFAAGKKDRVRAWMWEGA